MIRREVSTPAGTQWILISQVDHAHLAAKLAEHWGAGGVVRLAAGDALLWAIEHHDDGWHEWEQSPDVEPESGRPRSFTEMQLHDALAIWSRSIATAAAHGPLEGYAVAGHFCALLRRFDSGWKNDPFRAAAARQFLDTHDALKENCLRAWLAERANHTADQAALALAQLQLFDNFSLWFCCTPNAQSERLDTPQGPTITVAAQAPAATADPIEVTAHPWPLRVGQLNLEIPGRSVPGRRYENREDLAAAPAQSVLLRWRVEPQETAGARAVANR